MSTPGKQKDPVQTYFERMAEIRSTGGATSETSYYSALENLLNELGKPLKPQVICNGQLRNQGAGHPDFGLYSKNQCSKNTPQSGQGAIPERGVIEVKPLGDNSWQTAQGSQATKYLNQYGLVLVTNYREFRLIGEDDNGRPVERECFRLADDEPTFWSMAAHPATTARQQGAYFREFLQRVMMHAAPLARSEDIAWLLASYARDALTTLEEKEGATLAPLRTVLETALGMKFQDEKGEHFFHSTLVQTLFYGIFSAWVIWVKQDTSNSKFDWKSAGYTMTVPMIRSLFEEVAKPSRLEPLDLMDILDRTGEALNRIDRTAFFKTFDSGEAVQHFYEPFLEVFDPELRKTMGVWYTPREIVRYMVERVDRILRSELNIADGLADENVYVLDPCCGTGAYVIEVLRKIEKTLRAKGEDALIGQDVQEAARKRVFGFEIMPAPFVITHWQVGNLLADLGAPMNTEKRERPAIYLTNALTGWEPPSGPKAELPLFPEMEQERDQAEDVKRNVPILVVLGNPPYNAFAGTSPEEEAGLVEPYKEGLQDQWKIKKFNLDDLYIRFFRIAERRIAATGQGIICYISSYSYLSDPSFVVLRKNLLRQFNHIWIDSLNGDSRETGKRTPSGEPDPSVFSTTYNKEGIQQGTAIGLFLKDAQGASKATVACRDFWGTTKRCQLLDSLAVTQFDDQYTMANPQPWNRLSFRPHDVNNTYLAWPKLPDLGVLEPINGLMEKRSGALIDIDRSELATRMQTYFDKKMDWSTLQLKSHPLAKDAARYKAKETRTKALKAAVFDDTQIVRYIVRPFDVRHAYFTDIRPIWNEPRPQLWTQFSGGNQFLMTRKVAVASPEGPPTLFTRCLTDDHCLKTDAFCIPFQNHRPVHGMLSGVTVANLSERARSWLKHLGLPDPDRDTEAAAAPWRHALAITYSPQYLNDNTDGIAMIEWPRIPLPNERTLLTTSVILGAQVAALLDTEVDVPGVTSGSIAEHLRVLGGISNTDLRVTAGWGRRGARARTMPGRGRIEVRDWSEDEKEALRKGFANKKIDESRGFVLLGHAVDIWLNDTACWRGVPENVYNYVIGGYQVIKKWLSYREESILGRSLTRNEVREVTAMVRRLTTLVLLGNLLDVNYEACRDKSYSWPTD
ncbi:MAG: N-6 DNA methylase [Cyanobacteria bacterium MAG CAR1_bin_15]|nr:N-6 DNA methylase [Cyanobacteria bacterium MAG CAR1_bin_15]